MRGTPAVIAAQLVPVKPPVGYAVLHVKLTEIQKPAIYPMQNLGEQNWQTTLPAGLLMPVDRFWYYIEARDAGGETDTHWQPVQIVEPAPGDQQSVLPRHPGGWLAGLGALLGFGALIDHNTGGGDGFTPELPAPPVGGPSGGGEKEDDDDECEKTGDETVNYDKLSPSGDFGSDPIEVVVCGACPDATVSARTTWGASARIRDYNNPGCVLGNDSLILYLEKPESPPNLPGSETITVYANGHRIDTMPWPPVEP